jgi:uncharacterized protein YjbJ (UPF0337 family)
MNKEYFKGNWNQIKGSLKKTWGELTDNEITKAEGDYDKAVGIIQEKYSLKKDEVESKIDDLIKKLKS